MGAKYTTTSVSGYNASPPSDGGATTEENRITWTKIKSKLPDPLKTAIEAIDTALVAAFDFGPLSKGTTYTTVAGDHLKTISCTSAITVNLLDASTATAGYTVNISNQSTGNVTIGRATAGDTINGAASDMTLARGNSATLRVNTAATGYEVIDTGLKDIAGLAKTDGNIIVGDGTSWVAESGATARTSLGLATAALTDSANSFTATQTIQSTDDGATVGPTLVLDRDSASPAASDLIGLVQYLGEDSAGNDEEYAGAFGKIIDPTSTSEDGEYIVRTVVAGTLANRLHVGAGAYTSGATGGDKGANTINASAVYDDGVLLDTQGIAKAWVLFNGSGTVAITDSLNVTSITDNGTGSYTTNLTTAMANANYAVAAHARGASGNPNRFVAGVSTAARTTTAYHVYVQNDTGGTSDADEINLVFFGDQ